MTDLDGKTSIKNLFAVGEVAATGSHGANRLASNSLLEAVVFGRRTGKFIRNNYKKSPLRSSSFAGQAKIKINLNKKDKVLLSKIKTNIQKTMWEKVGIVRKKIKLLETLKQFKDFQKQLNKIGREGGISRELLEATNLIEVSVIITKSALARQKSLGAHFIE